MTASEPWWLVPDPVLMIQVYLYRWRNNTKRATLYRRKCHVIRRGPANSALVEFEDGQREIISRNALQKVWPQEAWK